MSALNLSRRTFLQGSAAAGAGLVVGFPAAANEPGPSILASWVRITPDDRVMLYTSVQEMGQGAWCVHARIVGEELEVPWDKIEVVQSPLDKVYAIWNPNHSTGGSASVRELWEPLRKSGAAARIMLVQAAADRLGVPASECEACDGAVVHKPSGRSLRYGQVADAAARLPVPENPPLKDRSQWRLIGNDAAMRKDIPSKVDGSAVFAVDVDVPGMLTATLLQAPVFGAKLKAVDPTPALAIKGVRHVVPMRDMAVQLPGRPTATTFPGAVVVVADRFWQAKKGLEALQPEWEEPAQRYADTTALYADLRNAALTKEEIVLPRAQRDATDKDDRIARIKAENEEAIAGAARTVEAEYQVPLLAHAQMEPMSAAAHVTNDGVELWAGTQASTANQLFIGTMLGIDPSKVKVHTLFSGGAFGRRYKNDFTTQAAYVAKVVGAPVKMIWTREEDMRQGWYRPAGVTRCRAGLDDGGKVAGVRIDMACANNKYGDSILVSRDENRSLYDWGAMCISSSQADSAVPCGPWRSVPFTVSAFATESFMDELAHASGADPLAFRLSLLSKEPRAKRLLETVAQRAGWGTPLPKGHGRGIALWLSFDSYAAQVVEVAVAGEALTVKRIICGIDCGTAVHPDGIRAQGESSIIMALTAAMMGEMNLENGRIVEGNYDTYPMLLLHQTPPMEILIVESPDAKVGGVGEPMTPPLAPALANAIFAATGKRIRSLPLSKAGLQLA